MSYDIEIFSVAIDGGHAYYEKLCYQTRMHCWSKYERVCEKHFLQGDGSCECNPLHFKELWNLDDIIGRSGKYAAEKCKETLDFLDKYHISPSCPDGYDAKLGLGCVRNLSAVDQTKLFAHELNKFLEIGEKYPNDYFSGDYLLDGITDYNGNDYSLVHDFEEDSEDEESIGDNVNDVM